MRLEFRHKGLKAFDESGETSGILPSHAARLRACLSMLRQDKAINKLSRFVHPMTQGSPRRGFWAMRVSAQWRLVFRIEDGVCRDIDYLNYH